MIGLVPFHRASPGLVAALLLLACGRPNPAFELAIETVSASASGGVTGSSGDAPTGGTTGVVATSGGASHTGSSGSGDDSSTGDATLTGVAVTDSSTGDTSGECLEPIAPGEPCGPGDCCAGCSTCQGGTCIPDSSLCGECGACDGDGLCIPKPERAPCVLMDDPCKGKVWGLQDGACLAAKSGSGVCQGGECITSPNCEAGEPIVKCDVSCIVDPVQCSEGAPVAQVDGAKLCAQDGPTDACTEGCLFDKTGDTAVKRSCVAGACVTLGEQACGNYACEQALCNMKCEDMSDCKEPHGCAEMKCL
jgi:hypothetical protein